MNTNRGLAVLAGVLLLIVFVQGMMLWKARRVEKEAKPGTGPYVWNVPNQAPRRPVAAPSMMMNVSRGWNDPFAEEDSDAWDPFKEMDAMQSAMNRMFRDTYNRGMKNQVSAQHALTSYNPDVDFKSTDTQYIATIDLPGIDKDKIDIKVKDRQLTLSGQREEQKEQSQDGGGYYRMERSFGSFLRSIPLPPDASEEGIVAESKNGVLTVKIPRIAKPVSSPKQISVQ